MLELLMAAAVSASYVSPDVSLSICDKLTQIHETDRYLAAADKAAVRYHLTPAQRLQVTRDCVLIAAARVETELSHIGNSQR